MSRKKLNAKVYQKARYLARINLAYCFRNFGYIIRWYFKGSFLVGWEASALKYAEEIGAKFEETCKDKEELEKLFEPS